MSKLPITSTVHYAVTAITKVKNGAMGEAMEAATQGISADKNISAWAIYALCASKTHDLNAVDQACKTIYQLLSVKDRQWFGGSTQPLEGVITLLHAQSLFKNHQIRRALEVINTQSQLSAGLMEVKLLCLVEQDSLDEAGKLLQGNTVLSSCQHQSWTGWLAYHKRDMHTAQQWLEQSIAEDSQQAVVHQWLGRVYWHIGNPQKAQASFLMAAKLDPQESESFL